MQVMPMMDDKSPDGRGVFAIPRVLTAMTNRHFVDGESPPLGGRGEFACVYPLAHSGRGLIESVEVFHLFDLTVNNMGLWKCQPRYVIEYFKGMPPCLCIL